MRRLALPLLALALASTGAACAGRTPAPPPSTPSTGPSAAITVDPAEALRAWHRPNTRKTCTLYNTYRADVFDQPVLAALENADKDRAAGRRALARWTQLVTEFRDRVTGLAGGATHPALKVVLTEELDVVNRLLAALGTTGRDATRAWNLTSTDEYRNLGLAINLACRDLS